MNKQFELASSIELEKRQELVNDFFNHILEPNEIPFILTDEANIYSFYFGDDDLIIKKCRDFYAIEVSQEMLAIPFWQFLDYVNKVL